MSLAVREKANFLQYADIQMNKRKMENFSEKTYFQRRDIYSMIWKEKKNEPVILKKAKALVEFLEKKEIILKENDLLAGYQQPYNFSEPYEKFSKNPLLVTFNSNLIYDLSWVDKKSRILLEEFKKAVKVGLFVSWMGGHVIPDYEGVLGKGFIGIRRKAENNLANVKYIDKDFLSSVVIICEGVENYIKRYAKKASLLTGKVKSKSYEYNLKRIAEVCEWVSINPPRTFFEALQLFWFIHEILTAEQESGSLSLGRFDQYIYPYYIDDLRDGRTTREEAEKLIEEIWIKFNGLSRGFQNITLGGQKIDGSDATNDISYICLEVTRKLQMPQPAVSVRYHSKTPEKFFNLACETIKMGFGLPALFNDGAIIPAKERMGIIREDAINYGIVGCVEPGIPGKEFSQAEALRINWAKVLELILNDGKCAVTGEKIKMKNEKLSGFNSFDDFYKVYEEELRYFVNLGIKALNILDKNFSRFFPYPYLSAIMSGCIKNNRDVTCGGTVCNLTSINGCGMANTADSLASIKKLVYEEKRITLRELKDNLRNNFSKNERLRQMLINRSPKYGNDDDYVDIFLKDLVKLFCNKINRYHNPRGGNYQCGLYTVDSHAALGKLTGALPDGRFSGKALANGLSPSQGVDKFGPTAVINSILKFDHKLLGNGMVLDLKFLPQVLANKNGFEKFKMLIKIYFELGGMELQFNVINKETLVKAQKSPDEYQNLIVRVSGFSNYFTSLDKALQDEIIERTEQCL